MLLSRCFLFTPGNREDLANKGWKSNPDYVILDLEDSVPIKEKDVAREIVRKVTMNGERKWIVRINGITTDYWLRDLIGVLNNNIDMIMVPKVESREDIKTIEKVLDNLEKSMNISHAIKIIALIESSKGLANIEEIASSSSRLFSMSIGTVDLSNELELPGNTNNEIMTYAKIKLIFASSKAGLHRPYDSVSTNFKDMGLFREECEHARAIGFAGKHAIHPSQVSIIKEVFSPTVDEIKKAQTIVEEYEKAMMEKKGAINIDGQMIDYPVYYKAKKILDYRQ